MDTRRIFNKGTGIDFKNSSGKLFLVGLVDPMGWGYHAEFPSPFFNGGSHAGKRIKTDA